MSKWLVVTPKANVALPPRFGLGSTERRMHGSDAGLAAAAAAAGAAVGLAASAGLAAAAGFGASVGLAAGAGGWLHAVSSATPKPRVWPSIRRREMRELVGWSPMRS